MSINIILDFPGELMHSNFENLSGKDKNLLLTAFAQSHDGKPLQIGYNGGIEVGQVIGTRVRPDRVGLEIEWRQDIEIVRQGGWDRGE